MENVRSEAALLCGIRTSRCIDLHDALRKMRAQYSDVFTGLGEYEKEYHIEVDSNVTPVIQRCRKVPYARYDKLKHTLVDLEKRGVIASVDRPT